MKDILQILVDTPIPTLLILGGLVFLLLSIADKVYGKIEVAEERKKYALSVGFLLLGSGLGIEVFGGL